jgi:FixJ family two-component response regulator
MLAGAGPEASAAIDTAEGVAELSARERELVALVARGRTDAQIAANGLGLGVATRIPLARVLAWTRRRQV